MVALVMVVRSEERTSTISERYPDVAAWYEDGLRRWLVSIVGWRDDELGLGDSNTFGCGGILVSFLGVLHLRFSVKVKAKTRLK
jgi:hypothetical protein